MSYRTRKKTFVRKRKIMQDRLYDRMDRGVKRGKLEFTEKTVQKRTASRTEERTAVQNREQHLQREDSSTE
jgi:hypothetical protein